MPASPEEPLPAAGHHGIATYRALRKASITWFEKIMQHPASKRFDLLKAGTKLGTPMQGRMFIFDDEWEMSMLMDFYIFDFRPAGRSLAESAAFAPGELTEFEAAFHDGGLASRTSLYLAVRVAPAASQILLRDQLAPGQPEVGLTDLNLAASVARIGGQILLFTRVVSALGLHVTGGFSFVFDPKHGSALVDGYRRSKWPVAPRLHDSRRTAYFLGRYRRIGIPKTYDGNEPPAP
jgi:hypothetical protein